MKTTKLTAYQTPQVAQVVLANENASKASPLKEIPEVVVDPSNKKRYLTGKLLGKGGFAKCFELVDSTNHVVYAGKIVSKTLLTKKHQKDKMAQEINIHRNLSHEHIVEFHSYFEDSDNVYILLELCSRRSLLELHKRRQVVTEPETRYFMQQIIHACQYLHDQRIIHRDLKLGNLFLNEDMRVKVGDFGLATRLDFHGERKRTLCGTPNYIAPEMLSRKGHSYEVDIWALGCIMYTLLVGKPPFQTKTLKDTYHRIKTNEYRIPTKMSVSAKHLIQKLLQAEPRQRPGIHDVLLFDFFTQGYTPSALPISCLSMAPNFNRNSILPTSGSVRRPLNDNTNKDSVNPVALAKKDQLALPVRSLKSVPENHMLCTEVPTKISSGAATTCDDKTMHVDHLLNKLQRQMVQLLNSKPNEKAVINQDEAEDPASTPVFWVGKWVDYSDKYGLGYQLCDNSVGVWFNDYTKMILNGNGESLQYIDRHNTESFYTLKAYPAEHKKKTTLLEYFRNYMNDHLLKAGSNIEIKEADELARLPCLQQWFRTRSAIIFHLNNGILQINFFHDHTKLIMCPLMGAVTYINEARDFRTFKFELLEQYGCSQELHVRLNYARNMVERLLARYSSKGSNLASTGSAKGLTPTAALPTMMTRSESAKS